MTTERELLPCPFCGGEAIFCRNEEVEDDGEPHDNYGGEWVECQGCHTCTNIRFALKEPVKPLLAEAWNRRAALAQPAPQYASPEDYARQNPLGGVARVFEVIAERLRAGENYDAVLWDYGLQRAAPQPAPAAERSTDGLTGNKAISGAALSGSPALEVTTPTQGELAEYLAPSTLSAPELSDDQCQAIVEREMAADHLGLDFYYALIRAGRATVAEDAARWQIVGELVDRQAEDEGLWFVAQTAPEDYLQRELRYLHAAIDAARRKP